ncbi:hypothetical protein LOK49_LG06G01403 [Camellia lanceoleosa]|uniref:Uncharacterized protein n=1 Tax=Camellia lanceoleosa TaxID=1840588 RepID=A0ACC0HI51_9ERIC|nr:hypothetical protein LOK49_LG06G01403 [Camellia lanceoleosa]
MLLVCQFTTFVNSPPCNAVDLQGICQFTTFVNSPPCNAVGLVDRFFLGVQHLYQHPVYRRTKECSVNSPDYGPLPLNSPEWCLAPFDPEGILSSLMAAITCVNHTKEFLTALPEQLRMKALLLCGEATLPMLSDISQPRP